MPKTAARRRAARGGRPGTPPTHGRGGSAVDPVPYLPGLRQRPVETGAEVVPPPTSATVAEATVFPAAERPRARQRVAVVAWATLVLLGAALLVLALAEVGPSWFDEVGAAAVATAYSWGLAARTGGRPVVFGVLALALSVVVVGADRDVLRTGAAVLTCVVSAVLAVMVTRPAVRFGRAAGECAVAVAVGAVGALATIGFAPVVSIARFEYVTFGLALLGAFAVVHRLGAGLHGLGRRGVGAVLAGGVLLVVSLLYAELLRRYGPPDAVDHSLGAVAWVRHHLGAFPRPIVAVLGVPALAWGCHMRARRRQGWWLCAFGVAAPAAVANSLVNPAVSLLESGLSVLYGVALGLAIGWLVIRVDLWLTGSGDRGGRRAEEAGAVRPEPPRAEPLL